MVDIEAFIKEYSAFYFKGNKTLKEKKDMGLSGLKESQESSESKVMEYLFKGEVNPSVVAWKTGRLDDNARPIRNENGNYLNGYGREIKATELETYLSSFTQQSKKEINQLIAQKEYRKAYETVLNSGNCTPDNFGSVYVINLLFFISKGTLPIYDKFAHKALRALLEGNVAPKDIYLNDAPSKSEVSAVMVMYKEYLRLLEKVFGKEELKKDIDLRGYKNREMFISRELDQALWVYGHADRAWMNDEKF